MTRNAIVNLPPGHGKVNYPLTLPAIAKNITAFDHIGIDWNNHGHAPFFYELPHFDFHFYMMPLADRLAIPEYVNGPAGFDNMPALSFLPSTYIAPQGGDEPQMGRHWVDVTSPELPGNGGTFTKTFIYGTYGGKVNFIEPMITLDLLKSGVASSTAIPQPDQFAERKYYPTVYNIYRDNGNQNIVVSLSNFFLR
jgi:hypothetical protein